MPNEAYRVGRCSYHRKIVIIGRNNCGCNTEKLWNVLQARSINEITLTNLKKENGRFKVLQMPFILAVVHKRVLELFIVEMKGIFTNIRLKCILSFKS